ncbi:MAG: heparinase II/III family protein [Chitinophagia bacterium]|jgi:hypothetical protein
MMRCILLILALAFFGNVSAQVTQRNILSTKYTLSDIQSNLQPNSLYHPFPVSPTEWRAAVPEKVLLQLVKDGESMLNYRFEPISASISLNYVRTGDRLEHSHISFGKRAALKKLIIAESIEKKGRFLEAILNGVWSICEESFWGVPAHIGNTGLPDVDHPVVELFGAETAAVLALTDYLVGKQLDSVNTLFRKRIYTETNRRIFIPMITESAQYGWQSKTRQVNNWNPWIHSNWMMATLLLEKDEQRRAAMLYQSMQGLDSYLNSLGDEGNCDEGPGYWFAAGASVFDCLQILSTSTNGKVDLYQEPLVKNMLRYITKVHIADQYFVNFADADPTVTPDGMLLYRMGKTIKDSTLSKMGIWAYQQYAAKNKGYSGSGEDFMRPRFLFNLLDLKEINQMTYEYTPLANSWMEDVQLLTARTAEGLFLAAHGGHNAESHNHNDVGDFIIYSNGEPFIIDAGRGNYTARTFSSKRYELWFTQSQYHNLPIVNGFGQLAGRNYAARNANKIINAEMARVNLDISSAYDPRAGVKEWNRTITLNKLKQTITCSDQFLLQQIPDSLQQVFITIADIQQQQPGEIILTASSGKKMLLKFAASDFRFSVDYPSMEGMEYSSFKTKWGGALLKRLVFHSLRTNYSGAWNFVFQPIK